MLVCAVSEFPELRVVQGSHDDITFWQGGAAQIVAYLDRTADVLRAEGLTVHTRIEYGAAADSILHAGEMTGADLVVMSSHGRSGLYRPCLGSVALKVVQVAPWPILLVRAKENVERYTLDRSSHKHVVRAQTSPNSSTLCH